MQGGYNGKEKNWEPILSRLWSIAFLLLLALLLKAYGQDKIPSPEATRKFGGSKVERSILQWERELGQAYLKRDTSVLERLLADDFLAVDFNGTPHTKAEAITELKSQPKELDSEPTQTMRVRIFGNVAIVQGSQTFTRTLNKKAVKALLAWMHVFVERDGRWQIVAEQKLRVPDNSN